MPDVVILDRIEPGEPLPDYCIHGRTTCAGGCGEWCWLGSKTYDAVHSGQFRPLCRRCAAALVPEGTEIAGKIRDHRRTDGPHG